ncbi:MAG: BrnT family toxin [Prochlorotrichaceae cyanobacterium]|jgi:uncharacterized DUF497 family protein
MEFNFQWDSQKDLMNRRKHGITFREATQIFKDPMALTLFDEEHSLNEDRWITLGLTFAGEYLLVIHTFDEHSEDSADIRIISARKATRNEIKQYEEGHL